MRTMSYLGAVVVFTLGWFFFALTFFKQTTINENVSKQFDVKFDIKPDAKVSMLHPSGELSDDDCLVLHSIFKVHVPKMTIYSTEPDKLQNSIAVCLSMFSWETVTVTKVEKEEFDDMYFFIRTVVTEHGGSFLPFDRILTASTVGLFGVINRENDQIFFDYPGGNMAQPSEFPILSEKDVCQLASVTAPSVTPSSMTVTSAVPLSPTPCDLAQKFAVKNTIILTCANSGFVDIFENWYESVRKVSPELASMVVLIAEDNAMLDYLEKRFPGRALTLGKTSSQKAATYDTKEYKTIVSKRPQYLSQFLQCGVSVLYMDADIVLLKNPFDYFVQPGDYDALLANDNINYKLVGEEIQTQGQLACTGFMFWKPSASSFEFLEQWTKSLAKGDVVNQFKFRDVLQKNIIKYAMLPLHDFPNGKLFWDDRLSSFFKSHPPVFVHNNYIKGDQNKIERFKASNLWNLPVTTTEVSSSQALGHCLSQTVTLVMATLGQPNRLKTLYKNIDQLAGASMVHEMVIVWNSDQEPSPEVLTTISSKTKARLFFPSKSIPSQEYVPLSLNNRYHPAISVQTCEMFILDDRS
eukprot:Lithocolla_globosa_v1_NODE_695_length_3420_cov_22.731055.p1 type:complete len:580 gc:universal NODE_695_length_3420_cov_22.731055:304-2043(+)